LLEVVGDECGEGVVAVLFEAAFDEVGAAAWGGGGVGYAHDAVDALSVEDALLAGGEGVAGQFDARADRADLVAVAPGLGDGRGGLVRCLQVAEAP
jgi:hypothetical protein